MTIWRATLVLLIAIVVAAGLGDLVGSASSGEPAPRGRERVLSKAPAAPQLPAYEPGSSWPDLPPPPEPEPVVESAGSSGGGEPSAGTYVPEATYTTPESSEGRPHGIQVEKRCGC